jgi:rod shape-determining protein MreD
MNGYAVISLLGLIAVTQTSILARISSHGWYPNLMLLSVIAWSLQRGPREGMLWGFAGGIALDLLSGAPLGLNVILLTLCGYLAGLGESRIFRTNFILPIVFVIVMTIGYYAMQVMILQFMGTPLPWLDTVIWVLLPSLALNLVFSPVVFRPLRWLSHHTGREQLRW